MRIGSVGFYGYNQNLSRIYWLELIEKQMRHANQWKTRLSLIAPQCEIEAVQKSPEQRCEDVAGNVEKA